MLSGDYILGDIDDDIKVKVKQNESKLISDLQFYSMFYRLSKRKDRRKLKKRLKELIVAHYEEKGYKAKFRLFSLTLILDWRE